MRLGGETVSPAVSKAAKALGLSPTRIEVLKLVLAHETSTAEVMEQLGLSRNGALQNLRSLENAGIVTERRVTHPRGSGPITYWAGKTSDVEGLIDDIFAFLVG